MSFCLLNVKIFYTNLSFIPIEDEHCFRWFLANVALQSPPRWITWHPSKDDCIVLNVDDSSLGNPRHSGYDLLLRNGDGAWVLEFHGHIGVTNNHLAYVLAIFHELNLA